jgi:hypothetical protein
VGGDFAAHGDWDWGHDFVFLCEGEVYRDLCRMMEVLFNPIARNIELMILEKTLL